MKNRRTIRSIQSITIAILSFFLTKETHAEAPKPNIVVIAIDDLNDWVGCSAGHPQAKTPNIDRLARQGILFSNAHVQATFCGPSRVSFLSGKMPRTTGCYDFEPYSSLKRLEGHPSFPLHFRRSGYTTFGGVKIFHRGTGKGWVAESWQTIYRKTVRDPTPPDPIHWRNKKMDWGPLLTDDKAMDDYQLAVKAADTLRTPHDSPLFVAVGFKRPHVPLYAPKKWFDLYPLDEVKLAKAPKEDMDDLPHPEIGLVSRSRLKHADLVRRDLWRSLPQAHLANISFEVCACDC